jgi:putative toxin-antitoxin system antitoxin component (TIGR02293 family)
MDKKSLLRYFVFIGVHNMSVNLVGLTTKSNARGRLRIAEERRDAIVAEAERIFGDPAKAHRWLSKPKWFLDEKTPIDVIDTASGFEKVKEMLVRIEYGMIG